MNALKLTSFNGVDFVDSRQVAEAVEKKHKDLLRDIRTYCEYITETKIAPSDYFVESTFKDVTGRTLPCYLVTRKGCEMIANKLTGRKGVIFTALYVNAFHEMQDRLTAASEKKSIGEIASLIKVLRSTMKDQKSKPRKIAAMAKRICDQFGIDLIDNFVEEKHESGQFVFPGFPEED